MTNSEIKNFSQNVSSSYHLEDRGKNIPQLRFKEYNDEWKGVKLKNICSDFIVPMRDKPKEFNGNIPWCRIEDIEGNYLHGTKSNQYVSQETIDVMNLKIIPTGSVICSCSASLGTYAINTRPIITNQTFIGLVCSDKISNHFLLNLMHTQTKKLRIIAGGTTIPYISREKFEEYNINIPNKDEQEKIASFLTLIDKKIEKQKELIELLKKYKRGLLSQIFSQNLRFKDNDGNDYPAWEEKTINNIFDTVTDFVAAGSFADLRKNVLYNEKPDFAQLVRTVDLKNNFKNKDFVFVSKSAYKYLWRVNLNEDALILPNIGANIGEVYYIYSFKLPYKNNVLGPNAILLKSSNNNLYYLYSGCLTDNFRKQLFLQVGASGQPKFNKTDFKKIKIKISINIDEQSKISKILSKFDDKIQQEECILNNLQTYKKGLLQQMFI